METVIYLILTYFNETRRVERSFAHFFQSNYIHFDFALLQGTLKWKAKFMDGLNGRQPNPGDEIRS